MDLARYEAIELLPRPPVVRDAAPDDLIIEPMPDVTRRDNPYALAAYRRDWDAAPPPPERALIERGAYVDTYAYEGSYPYQRAAAPRSASRPRQDYHYSVDRPVPYSYSAPPPPPATYRSDTRYSSQRSPVAMEEPARSYPRRGSPPPPPPPYQRPPSLARDDGDGVYYVGQVETPPQVRYRTPTVTASKNYRVDESYGSALSSSDYYYFRDRAFDDRRHDSPYRDRRGDYVRTPRGYAGGGLDAY